jgi:hypothetical protein
MNNAVSRARERVRYCEASLFASKNTRQTSELLCSNCVTGAAPVGPRCRNYYSADFGAGSRTSGGWKGLSALNKDGVPSRMRRATSRDPGSVKWA